MKNIKKIKLTLLFLAIVSTSYIACSKQVITNEETEATKASANSKDTKSVSQKIMARVIGESNSEVIRILEAITNPDNELSVIDNPNFGYFSSAPQYDIFLGGFTSPTVKLRLDGRLYTPTNTAGNWNKQSLEFKNYYGKNVKVDLFDNQNSTSEELYIPKAITVKKLGPIPNSIEINRFGNKLQWEPDPLNLSKKVVFYYTTYSDATPASNEGIIGSELLVIDDNGIFDLRDILADTNIKRISFSLIRGNATSFITSEQKKVMFTIRCVDSHEYIVQ